MDKTYQTHVIRSHNKHLVEQGKLLVIHPHSKYKNLLTSLFVEKYGQKLFYYAVQEGQQTLSQFINGLLQEWGAVIDGFDGQTRSALDKSQDPATLAQALVEDVRQAAGGPFGLWLDQIDQVRLSDGFMAFFAGLKAALPAESQLLIYTRVMPHQPWNDLLTEEGTVLLGEIDYPIESDDEDLPLLEVYALGAGRALLDGEPITSWDGALPRNLFFFFVDRPLVTRDEVFATFWPDLSVKEATNVFHVTKRKISERLDHELTSYNSGFYIPSGQMKVHYDAVAFLENIEQAATLSDEEAYKRYRYAIDLYRGDFLANLDMEWAAERRYALRTSYSQALIALGRICNKQERSEEALGYFLRALHETPEREDIHREVMKLYAKLGHPEDAKAQYERLAAELDADLGIAPSRESRELYESLA